MMVHDRAVADHRRAADVGVGADDDVSAKLHLRFDDGRGMDCEAMLRSLHFSLVDHREHQLRR